MTEEKSKKNITKRVLIILLALLLFVGAVLGGLYMGCWYTKNFWDRRWYPDYAKEDISDVLGKGELTEEDYELLYRQTGLTKLAVDDMRDTAYGRSRILEVQDAFFRKYTVVHEKFAPFTYAEQTQGQSVLCDLQDGDILVTATTRVSWWRYGHAALVVDGENDEIAEVLAPGEVSDTTSAHTFAVLADFIVLRPKVDPEVKAELVEYVLSDMMDVPYNITAGILSPKFKKELTGTQCAHFVWYAYKKFGIDLDSNGGMTVKPQDIFRSERVEVVQAFGFDLDALWS